MLPVCRSLLHSAALSFVQTRERQLALNTVLLRRGKTFGFEHKIALCGHSPVPLGKAVRDQSPQLVSGAFGDGLLLSE
jgi:hypothetical protein